MGRKEKRLSQSPHPWVFLPYKVIVFGFLCALAAGEEERKKWTERWREIILAWPLRVWKRCFCSFCSWWFGGRHRARYEQFHCRITSNRCEIWIINTKYFIFFGWRKCWFAKIWSASIFFLTSDILTSITSTLYKHLHTKRHKPNDKMCINF